MIDNYSIFILLSKCYWLFRAPFGLQILKTKEKYEIESIELVVIHGSFNEHIAGIVDHINGDKV